MAIYRGPGGAGDATVDATNATAYVTLKTEEATNAALSAAASAAEAAASAVIASDGLDGIAAYAAAAAGSAADALASETNAADSETNAAISAANADEDAGTASTKANEASDSADDAAASAAAAANSASSAATSASNAATSATSASNSANSAANSASDAAVSASLADGYLPSSTGNSGKYLRTNGTSNYWDTVTDVAAATLTNDGVVFGFTDESTLQSTTTYTYNSTIYPYTPQTVLSGDGPAGHVAQTMAQAIINGDIVVGDPIKVTALKVSTSLVEEINLGTVSACSGLYNGSTSRWEFSITTTNPNSWNSSGYYNPGAGIYLYTIISGPTSYGDENTQLGYNAGSGLTLGIKNVIIGSRSATNLGNGSNNIIIGQGAQGSAVDVSNEITLGKSTHTKTRLFGALAMGGSSVGTSGQVLTSSGSGAAPTWTTPAATGVTSVALSAPTGLTVSGSPVTSTGTLALSYTAGYSIPTTASQTNWDTSYGWGNHASAGYLTSATAATTYQPLDGDLTAIAALSGTNGFLTKTGTNTWSIDTTSYVSSVAATSPVASSGGATPTISLSSGYGDTQNPFASKTANYVLAAPNGTAGAPTFRAIVAADIPTLNQNTTGTAANITATSNSTLTTLSSLSLPGSQVSGNISGNAANVTGTVAVANGGSGQTTAQTAMNAFAGAVTSGSYLRGNGTNVVMSTIQAADVPTLNQNTTGTASNVTGTVAVANGGTGSTTLTANNVLLGNGTSALQVVAPGTSGNVLTSNGTTWISSAASGGGGQFYGTAATKAIAYNSDTIAENITITAGTNGLSAGPVTISTGYTVTVNGNWVIV